MRRAAVFRHNLFVHSETFIRDQAAAMRRYAPVFIARRDLHDVPTSAEAHAVFDKDSRAEDARYGVTGKSRRLNTLLARLNVDLVHAHFGPDALYAVAASKAQDLPLVATLHGRDATVARFELLRTKRPVAMRYALLRPRLADHASLVLCVSEEIRRAAEVAGMNPKRLRTHYIGVDAERLQRPTAIRPPVVLHVARLVEKKGTSILLDAMAAVIQQVPDATLVILGDGPLRKDLEKQADELGIRASVDFEGRVTQDEVHRRMAEARVFCLPSVTATNGDREGLPIALLEAMASGMAVVATRHSGIPEAVTSSTGLLVEERDAAALARALQSLLADDKAAQELGDNASERVRSTFNVTKQTQLLESMFDEL